MSQSLDIVECPICKKRFIPAASNIYVVTDKKLHRIHVCGWNCFNKASSLSMYSTRNKQRSNT